MNQVENHMREMELIEVTEGGHISRMGRAEPQVAINRHQDLFLNDSLRSFESSVNGEDSIQSISEGDMSIEDEALLGPAVHPRPNIPALFRVLYDYARYALAAFMFVYSFVLIFSAKGQCFNGSGSLRRLPKISRELIK